MTGRGTADYNLKAQIVPRKCLHNKAVFVSNLSNVDNLES